MRTINITLYKFDELPAEAQEKAISRYFHINVDYCWWDSIYEDAWNINLKIKEFDLNCKYDIKGIVMYDARDTASIIVTNHGSDTDTYRLADQYLADYNKIIDKFCNTRDIKDISSDKFDEFENELEPYSEQFEEGLLDCYWRMLRDEYDHLTSEEQIKEALIANEYEFTTEGKIYK